MRVICVLALFLLMPAFSNQRQQHKSFAAPVCFLKAGKFLEVSEFERVAYTTGLMDGFFGSGLFGASDETVNRFNSCTKDMDSKQLTAIIAKYVTDHPETWHLPLSVEAYNALNSACPGGLRVIALKD